MNYLERVAAAATGNLSSVGIAFAASFAPAYPALVEDVAVPARAASGPARLDVPPAIAGAQGAETVPAVAPAEHPTQTPRRPTHPPTGLLATRVAPEPSPTRLASEPPPTRTIAPPPPASAEPASVEAEPTFAPPDPPVVPREGDAARPVEIAEARPTVERVREDVVVARSIVERSAREPDESTLAPIPPRRDVVVEAPRAWREARRTSAPSEAQRANVPIETHLAASEREPDAAAPTAAHAGTPSNQVIVREPVIRQPIARERTPRAPLPNPADTSLHDNPAPNVRIGRIDVRLRGETTVPAPPPSAFGSVPATAASALRGRVLELLRLGA